MPSSAFSIQYFLSNYFTASPAIFFQNAQTYPSSFEGNVLLILSDDVSGRFSGGNQASYSFLKQSLNCLLTDMSCGYNWLIMTPEITTKLQLFLSSLTFSCQIGVHERRQGLNILGVLCWTPGPISQMFFTHSYQLNCHPPIFVHTHNVFWGKYHSRYYSVIENNIKW